jgi:serine/threonine protein kinase
LFGGPAHIEQAYGYGLLLQNAFTFSTVSIILASDKRIRIMTLDHQTVKISREFPINFDSTIASEGLLVLRWFLSKAKLEGLPKPQLTFYEKKLTFVPEHVDKRLYLKKASQVYSCGIEVLKHVASPEAYRRELKALQLLRDYDHDNLVRLRGFSVEETDGWLLLFPKGECTLAVAYGELERTSAVQQVMAGTKWLHSMANLIHRDIRPENVVVLDRRCVLIDLGHAVVGPRFEDDKFIGVPMYAAQEHAKLLTQPRIGAKFAWTRMTDLESICKMFDILSLNRHGINHLTGFDPSNRQIWETWEGTRSRWYEIFNSATLSYEEASQQILDCFSGTF